MQRSERISQLLLHSGFLAVMIAWHELVLDKIGLLSPLMLMLVAAFLWFWAGVAFMWNNSSRILQQEIKGCPPPYYLFLAVPFCTYAAIAPWALLQILGAIRAPAETVFGTVGM
jgi:hypothetical protein